jgi:hypothetical protein
VYPHLKRHLVDLQNSLAFEFGLSGTLAASQMLLFANVVKASKQLNRKVKKKRAGAKKSAKQ